MCMLPTDDDHEIGAAYTAPHFLSPVLVDRSFDRLVHNTERGIGSPGLCDEVAAQVPIVVIVKTHEYTCGCHS